jgi:hypothetical protein
VHHLFFGCCVAKLMWSELSEVVGIEIKPDFESVAKMWVLGKKFRIIIVCTSAMLWSIWKFRNGMIFQGRRWTSARELLWSCSKMMRDWRLLNTMEDGVLLEELAGNLERRSWQPPRLPGTNHHRATPFSASDPDHVIPVGGSCVDAYML